MRRAHRIGWTGGIAAAVIAGAIGGAMAMAEAWASIFTGNSEIIQTTATYLVIVGPFYAYFGLGLSLYFASQGAGTVIWPVVSAALRLLVVYGGGVIAVRVFDVGFAGLLALVAAGMMVYGLGIALSVLLGARRGK